MSDPPVIAEGLYSYQIGGSERVGVELAIEFARRGYRVVCFAFYDSDGPMRQVAESAGIRCIDFNYLKRPWGIRRLTYQIALWRMLRRERVEALHIHHVTALILSGLPARAAQIPRVVMTEHALHQLIAEPSYRRAAMHYCKLANAITVVEPQQAQYFHDELLVPTSKLHYVPNGSRLRARDLATGRLLRRQIGVPDDAFVLFFAGRLHPIKGIDTLLNAVSRVSPDIRQTLRVVLAGDGPERERLEQQRDSLGLHGSVTFLGARNDVADLLHLADAFIMTSISEGLPMALLEAMALGVPCIATSVGGIPALFEGGCGILVTPANPTEIAAAITRVIMEPDLRRQFSERGQHRIKEKHDLDNVVTQYLALLGLPPQWRAELSVQPIK